MLSLAGVCVAVASATTAAVAGAATGSASGVALAAASGAASSSSGAIGFSSTASSAPTSASSRASSSLSNASGAASSSLLPLSAFSIKSPNNDKIRYSAARISRLVSSVPIILIESTVPSSLAISIRSTCSTASSVKNGNTEPINSTPRFIVQVSVKHWIAAITKKTGISTEHTP